MVVPSGDHAGAVKKIGAKNSGGLRVASVRAFCPSTSEITTHSRPLGKILAHHGELAPVG